MLLLTASFIYRILFALRDGLSDRVKTSRGRPVGWLPWHIAGWLVRDCVQIYFYYTDLGLRCTVHDVPAWLALATANFALHAYVYGWAEKHVHLFTWGWTDK